MRHRESRTPAPSNTSGELAADEGALLPTDPADVASALAYGRASTAEGPLEMEDGKHNVFFIKPFWRVAGEVGERLRRLGREHPGHDFGRISETVQTFQGREADVVVFLLGGDPKSPGAISGYATAEPNLLNVAVTRARRRVYVISDHAQWARHAYYSELARASVGGRHRQHRGPCSRPP